MTDYILNIDGSNFRGKNLSYLFAQYGISNVRYSSYNDIFKSIGFYPKMRPIPMHFRYISLNNLNSINWKNINNIEGIFMGSNVFNEDTIDNICNLDTSNITDMSGIFAYCNNLTNLNLSNWNMSNVINIDCIFEDCYSLKNINLSNWNTSNIVNTSFMFSRCRNLTNLDLSNWNTSNITSMYNMFMYCDKLINLTINSNSLFKIVSPNIFYGTPIENGTGFVYVPNSMVNQYKEATNWVQYANSIRPITW